MAINESQHPPASGFGPSSQFRDTQGVDEPVAYAFPGERRKAGYHPPCALIIDVQDRLMQGDTAIGAIRTAQQELKDDTKEVLEILNGAKTFFRMARVVGRIIGWAAPLVAIFFAWKGWIK
jgi:hypothetical protein